MYLPLNHKFKLKTEKITEVFNQRVLVMEKKTFFFFFFASLQLAKKNLTFSVHYIPKASCRNDFLLSVILYRKHVGLCVVVELEHTVGPNLYTKLFYNLHQVYIAV